MYDVIVIGGGPAGLTASLYTSRRGLKTLLVSSDIGGQMLITPAIENYPGTELVSGPSLAQSFRRQVEKCGAEIRLGMVEKIEKQPDGFSVFYNQEQVSARSIILAFGLTPRNLDVPGEREFRGKGVSYCVSCDGHTFQNKTVAVIGGGNSALDGAHYLASIASHVYLIHRSKEIRGDKTTFETVQKKKNIEIILDTTVKEVRGQDRIKEILIEDANTHQARTLSVDGIFVHIGFITRSEFLKGFVDLNDHGEVIVDHRNQTNVPGIFAAGDITNMYSKQIAISTGEGAKAALSCYKYLKNTSMIAPDWKTKK